MSRTPRSICECHCGTRIDINPKLVEERQAWKEKCLAMEEQNKLAMVSIKEKIYKQCSMLMEKEFKAKEDEYRIEIAKKNADIHSLNLKLQNFQARDRVNAEEAERLKRGLPGLQQLVRQLEDKLAIQRRNAMDDIRQLQDKHHYEVEALEREKIEAIQKEKKYFEPQLVTLKQLLCEFQCKYKVIVPEVEKLKSQIASKNAQNEDLKKKLSELTKQSEQKIAELTKKVAVLKKADQTIEIKALQRDLEDRERELLRLRGQRREVVKTEIKEVVVYVDRPVEVQRVVQKIVEVQKVVKQFVQPKQPVIVNQVHCQDQGTQEYEQLIVQINNRTRYIADLQNELSQRQHELRDYERLVGDYERNIEKYKSQRTKLASTIADKNRQIEQLQHRLQSITLQLNSFSTNNQDKIVVNVRKDGTYTTSTGEYAASRPNVARDTKKTENRTTAPVAARRK